MREGMKWKADGVRYPFEFSFVPQGGASLSVAMRGGANLKAHGRRWAQRDSVASSELPSDSRPPVTHEHATVKDSTHRPVSPEGSAIVEAPVRVHARYQHTRDIAP